MSSLLAYRRAVQAELGPFVVVSTTTAAADLVSFTSSSLVNANAPSSAFQNGWAYLNASTGPNLAAQSPVANTAGYDAAAGSVTVAQAYATSVTSGMGVEISMRLPAITDSLGVRGVREIVNDVLQSMPPIDLLPVTGVTGQAAYDVTALYSWITDPAWILGVYFQDVGDDYPRATGIRWEWQHDVDTPRLLLPSEPFTTGQTFYLKARRPAQTWIRQVGGSWTADTDGLQYDNDEALPLLSTVRAQALSVTYRQLGAVSGPGEYTDYWRKREVYWTARAYALRWWNDPKADEDMRPRVRMAWPSRPYGLARGY